MSGTIPTPTTANFREFLVDTLHLHVPQGGNPGSGVDASAQRRLRTIAQYSSIPHRPPETPLDTTTYSLPSIWLAQHGESLFPEIPTAVRRDPLRGILDTSALIGPNEGVLLTGLQLIHLPNTQTPLTTTHAWDLVRESETFHKVFRAGFSIPTAGMWGDNVPDNLPLSVRWTRIATRADRRTALLFYLRTLLQRYPTQYVTPAIDTENVTPPPANTVTPRASSSAPAPASRRQGTTPYAIWLRQNNDLLTDEQKRLFTLSNIVALNYIYNNRGVDAFNAAIERTLKLPASALPEEEEEDAFGGGGGMAFAAGGYDPDEGNPFVNWIPLGQLYTTENVDPNAPDEEEEESDPIVLMNPATSSVAAPAPTPTPATPNVTLNCPYVGEARGTAGTMNRYVCQITNPTRTLFSFIPTVRPQLTGFWAGMAWSVKTPLAGIQVKHDTRLIRRRILSGMVYNPGATHENPSGVFWDQLARIVYAHVRSPNLFTANDGKKNYYASMAFFFEGVPGTSFSFAPGIEDSDEEFDPFNLDDIYPEDVDEAQRRDLNESLQFLNTPVRTPWCPERAIGTAYDAANPHGFLIDYMREYIVNALTSGGSSAVRALNKYRLYIEVQWINDKRANRRSAIELDSGSRFATAVDAGVRAAEVARADQIVRSSRSISATNQAILNAQPALPVGPRLRNRPLLNPPAPVLVRPRGQPPIQRAAIQRAQAAPAPAPPPPPSGRVTRQRAAAAAAAVPAPPPPVRNVRQRVAPPVSTRVLRPRRPNARLRVGAYIANSLQEQMFVRGSLKDRFYRDKSIFMTPEGRRNTCAPMSLFRAERTIYDCSSTGTVTASRKGPSEWEWCEDEILIPIVDCEKWDTLQVRCPFVKEVAGERFLRLSYAGKHLDPTYDPTTKGGGPYLPGALDPAEIEVWEYATEEMLATMEFQLNRPIDVNNLEDICQAFADCFATIVSVYDSELRGKRIDAYTPFQLSPKDLAARFGKLMIVNILHDQGHCHAITHLQTYLSGRKRQRFLRPYQICPICDKCAIQELNTQEAACKHISKCVKSCELLHTYQATTLFKNFQGSSEVIRRAYVKVQGRTCICSKCATCNEIITQEDYMAHKCLLPTRERKPLEDQNLYVYDMESAQLMTDRGVQTHECNCVCMKKVYPDSPEEERGISFPNEVAFMEALVASDGPYKNGVFIAHNGGGYDSLFLLRVIERWDIPHHSVPSPSSDHKFLMIHLIEQNITFLDSMRFIPGSLRGIAESFGCSVSKGDFPHRFNDGKSLDYEGPIPPHEDETDYWCQKFSKNAKQQREWEQWYQSECEKYCTCWGEMECTCGKEPWRMRQILFEYCMLDVHVLAEVCRLYREETIGLEIGDRLPDTEIDWRPPIVDPFTYMTLAQITVNTLALGFRDSGDLLVTLHQRTRGGQNPKAIYWLEQLQTQSPQHKIYHRGNHWREYYSFGASCFVDGYCFETDTVYLFLDCSYWGCKCCYPEEHAENHWNDFRHMTFLEMERHFDVMMMQLSDRHKRIVTLWGHDFESHYPRPTITPYDKEVAHLLQYSDCFYGGRTEAFALYADARVLGKAIKYFDVCSLYPSTYLMTLPTGTPQQLLGGAIYLDRLDRFAEDRYFGFIRCKVRTNPEDKIGLLPVRDASNGRLTFPVGGSLKGCWHTEELYLCMEHGYEIEEVYEAYVWESDQRSNQHIRGYVAYFLRMKQEAEGWKKLGASSDNPDEEEQQRIVEHLYLANGRVGRIRPERVHADPVKRQLAKLYLNALWGKFAQKESTTHSLNVFGPEQFDEIWSLPELVKESFRYRETSPGVYKVHYKVDEAFTRHVGHGNVLFAATVTAHARCVLHRKIMEVGYENVLYCDTDSVIFLDDPQAPMQPGFGLGEWTDEYPDQHILRFAAMAPKMYMLEVEGSSQHKVRAKGVQLSLRNQRKLQIECVQPLLERIGRGDIPTDPIQLENMIISTNSRDAQFEYGTMLTRTGEKKAQVVLSKRTVVIDPTFTFEGTGIIRTLPLPADLA